MHSCFLKKFILQTELLHCDLCDLKVHRLDAPAHFTESHLFKIIDSRRYVCMLDTGDCGAPLSGFATKRQVQTHYAHAHYGTTFKKCAIKGCPGKVISIEKHNYYQHRTSSGQARYICHEQYCTFRAMDRRPFLRHVRKCSASRDLKNCPYMGCLFSFNHDSQLPFHLERVHGEKRSKVLVVARMPDVLCTKCNFTFSSKTTFKAHLGEVRSDIRHVYTGNNDTRIFVRLCAERQTDTPRIPYCEMCVKMCDRCGARFWDEYLLGQHQQEHMHPIKK